MLPRLTRFVTWSLAAALLAVSPMVGSVASADDEPVEITIRVTDAGFEPNNVEVEQGALVHLTFVWDHVGYPADEHIMVIPQFKVESDQIDAANREATVEFIATESGTFQYKCDLECDLHDFLQNGVITVVPSGGGGGGGAALTPTTLTIGPGGVSVVGNDVGVIASLVDDEGNPVSKAELRFFIEETFVDKTALVEISTAETDDTGFARISYRPSKGDPASLVVQFDGGGVYASSETAVGIPSIIGFIPPEVSSPETLSGLRAGAPMALALVIAGIWAFFAFVLYKVWGVSRVKAKEGEP